MVIAGIVIVHMLVYIFIYDKSFYHIDTVREPMIRFLFFEAMLIGAYFKIIFDKERNNFKILGGVVCIMRFVHKLGTFCFKNTFFKGRENKRISNNKSVCFAGIVIFYYEVFYRNRQ